MHFKLRAVFRPPRPIYISIPHKIEVLQPDSECFICSMMTDIGTLNI